MLNTSLNAGDAGEPTDYVRLHEGFATNLGLELNSNDSPTKNGMTPQRFRFMCYAPDGFNVLQAIPNKGAPVHAYWMHIGWKLPCMIPASQYMRQQHMAYDNSTAICKGPHIHLVPFMHVLYPRL